MKSTLSKGLSFPCTLSVGGQSMPALVDRIERRVSALLSPWLKGALASKSLQVHTALQSVKVVAVTPEELGIKEGPGHILFSHISNPELRRRRRLSLCTHDVAFSFFLAHQGKFGDERLLVMTPPLRDHQQEPVLLEISDVSPGVQAVWAKPTFPTLFYQRLLFVEN